MLGLVQRHIELKKPVNCTGCSGPHCRKLLRGESESIRLIGEQGATGRVR
jgi:hypothetical protein